MASGIPETIKIGGLIYDVIMVQDRNFENGHKSTGSCNVAYQKIWLEYGNRKLDGIKDDLLHEILEAIATQCDLDINHHALTALGTMLNQVLRENRLVFFENDATPEPVDSR